MKPAAALVLTLPLLAAVQPPPSAALPAAPRSAWGFEAASDLDGWELQATGAAAKRMPRPKVEDGRLLLLEAWSGSSAAAAVPFSAPATASVELDFTFVVNTGTEGFGLAWLDTGMHGTEAKVPAEPREPFGPGVNTSVITLEPWGWEAPNFARGFGVGFDASNPPNRDPFGGSGNLYDRPQHEVSLHWDGLEIVKATTPRDFRDDKPHRAKVRVDYVTGGALVTLQVDGDTIFERHFIPSMTPFPGRPVFGARNGATAGDVRIDDLKITTGAIVPPPPPPLRVTALSRILNDKDHGTHAAVVDFPSDTRAYGRILCTLRLDRPETRFDPWDRLAHVNLVTDTGETFELLRYITPYHRGHVWQIDVSDFRPLLRGRKKIVQVCGTQGEGWIVSVHFDFHPGPAERYANQVVTLWSGHPEIGNPAKPANAFFTPRRVPVPPGTTAAKVRSVVTGHGMEPNTDNAGEFMPLDRTLTVNGRPTTHRLWKADNYLNPCRPQGGTWKYDRAGWAPGDVVRPWEVDATPGPAGHLDVTYALAPYENKQRGKTWAPSHRTEVQLVFYGERPR